MLIALYPIIDTHGKSEEILADKPALSHDPTHIMVCHFIWLRDHICQGVLNNIKIGGFKLGFWFAQQGVIYGFVVIIFIYTIS